MLKLKFQTFFEIALFWFTKIKFIKLDNSAKVHLWQNTANVNNGLDTNKTSTVQILMTREIIKMYVTDSLTYMQMRTLEERCYQMYF